ncbi:MAG: hypothetical protein NZ942_02850 [Candidatus Aenigmarchaeota archaeon]|nr:hypothetical protein [Candidatus Aenigmarchaeota archaeon]
MKGYVKYLAGFIAVIVIFAAVNFFLASMLSRECDFSDYISRAYILINKIEFAKLNAKQALQFSFQKTLSEMGIRIDDLKNDDNLRQNFLEKLNESFNPQPIEASLKVEKVSLEFNSDLTKIIARIKIFAWKEYQDGMMDFFAETIANITYEIG